MQNQQYSLIFLLPSSGRKKGRKLETVKEAAGVFPIIRYSISPLPAINPKFALLLVKRRAKKCHTVGQASVKFAFERRNDCKKAVINAGGICLDKVAKSLDYLVVGLMGNEDWMYFTFGRKIQQAIDYNKKGCKIMIVGEEA